MNDHETPSTGYTGHIHGSRHTFGKTFEGTLRTDEVKGAESLGSGLPELLQPTISTHPSLYYGNFEHGQLFKGCMRNRSHVHVGDDRDVAFDTMFSRDFKDPHPRELRPPRSHEEVQREYVRGLERCPEWRIDEIEQALRSKIAQRFV